MNAAEYRSMVQNATNNAAAVYAEIMNKENAELKIGDIITAKNSKIARQVISIETDFVVADRMDIPFASQPNFRAWLNPQTIKLVSKAGA